VTVVRISSFDAWTMKPLPMRFERYRSRWAAALSVWLWNMAPNITGVLVHAEVWA
jgi:hypothetical protein